jgi:hypothetical protein
VCSFSHILNRISLDINARWHPNSLRSTPAFAIRRQARTGAVSFEHVITPIFHEEFNGDVSFCIQLQFSSQQGLFLRRRDQLTDLGFRMHLTDMTVEYVDILLSFGQKNRCQTDQSLDFSEFGQNSRFLKVFAAGQITAKYICAHSNFSRAVQRRCFLGHEMIAVAQNASVAVSLFAVRVFHARFEAAFEHTGCFNKGLPPLVTPLNPAGLVESVASVPESADAAITQPKLFIDQIRVFKYKVGRLV